MARSLSQDSSGKDVSLSPSIKFETALAELESLVATMENGNLPLEESINAYRRGTELLRHCRSQLTEAEHKIQILEQTTLTDFEPLAEEKS